LHVTEDVGNGKAPFLSFDRSFGRNDLGVHEGDGLRTSLDVDHRHALDAADLGRGETYPLGRVHRLEHVVDQPLNFRRYRGDQLRFAAQDRVAEDPDLEHAHVVVAGAVVCDTTFAIRPRSTMRRDSPDLIVTSSSIAGVALPSVLLSLMCTTS